MGYTWTKPVSTTPSQDYKTPAVTTIPAYDYLNTSYDTTGYWLKFRVQHLSADVQAEYWKLFAGVSVRYNSHVRNIDKVFVTF